MIEPEVPRAGEVARPRLVQDLRPVGAGDRHRGVGGAGIDDHDLVGEAGQRVQARAEDGRLVAHDQRGGEQGFAAAPCA